jgi:hypothetical protein
VKTLAVMTTIVIDQIIMSRELNMKDTARGWWVKTLDAMMTIVIDWIIMSRKLNLKDAARKCSLEL